MRTNLISETFVARDFVLFKTDLFLFRQPDEDINCWCVGGDCAGWFYVRLLCADKIRRDCEPVMEDWGWTFAVSVDGIRIKVNVWAYLEIENCWLFGLESQGRWLAAPSSEKRFVAKESVATALDAILATDSRFEKHAWFAENPFDLNAKDFRA